MPKEIAQMKLLGGKYFIKIFSVKEDKLWAFDIKRNGRTIVPKKFKKPIANIHDACLVARLFTMKFADGIKDEKEKEKLGFEVFDFGWTHPVTGKHLRTFEPEDWK